MPKFFYSVDSSITLVKSEGLTVSILQNIKDLGMENHPDILKILNLLLPPYNNLKNYLFRGKLFSLLGVKDGIRDQAIQSFFHLGQGYTYSPIAATAEAAQKVVKLFEEVGVGIINRPYTDETTFLDIFIAKGTTQEYIDLFALLPGMPEAFTAIKEAHEDFVETKSAFDIAKNIDADADYALYQKREIVDVINWVLIPFLTSAIRTDEATWLNLAKSIRGTINKENTAIAMGNQNEEEEPQPEDPIIEN